MKTLARFYLDVFLALWVKTFVIIKQNNQKFISAGNSARSGSKHLKENIQTLYFTTWFYLNCCNKLGFA